MQSFFTGGNWIFLVNSPGPSALRCQTSHLHHCFLTLATHQKKLLTTQSVRGWKTKGKKVPNLKTHTWKTACHTNLTKVQCGSSSSDHSTRTYHHHHSRLMPSLCTVFTGLMSSPKMRNKPADQQKHQVQAVLGGF